MTLSRMAILFAIVSCMAIARDTRGADVDELALRKAVSFYASFDESVNGDVGRGSLAAGTRAGDPNKKGQFLHEKGVDPKVFRIAREKGIAGGALEVVDVLPRDGRMFYPAKGNLAFKPDGWSGAISMWCKTDPDRMLKTKFCDPIQITQKTYNDGAVWFDFNDARPRDLRLGVFTALKAGQKAIAENDPNVPMVRVPKVGWKADEWHHLVISWRNFDSGKPNAVAALYIDGKLMGEVKDRAITMGWEMEKANIYLAINYIGLLDELVVFDRALTGEEIAALRKKPGLIAGMRK